MPPEWMTRQAGIIHERCKQMDVVITTALIPGRPAPKLVKADTVAAMKPGAVLVDLAIEQGGNVEGAELGRIVQKNGVTIVGIPNLAATVPADASALYSRNVLNFLALSLNLKTGEFALPKDDEIVQATLVCADGQVVTRKT
jgi:NAD(P) transhydrogenase subunit alpha